MTYELNKSSHSVYALQYHFIQCVKYRRNVLINPKIINMLKEKVNSISKTFEVTVLNIETDKNYYHLLFKCKPTLNIPKYINAIKVITSREIRRTFPEVKKKLWQDKFWSRSYFLTTTGQVTLEQIKKYIDNQGK